ncbi:hypothetical protein VCHENC02_5612B, partial [Vibrio harveyi]
KPESSGFWVFSAAQFPLPVTRLPSHSMMHGICC